MNYEHTSTANLHVSTRLAVASGIVALAAAMGIGRFAFTPLLPLMLHDGTLNSALGAEWAAANYGGYLAGAVTAFWFSGNPRQGLRLSLYGVAITTLAVAWVGHGVPPAYGAVLRAAAGVFSAWALICASTCYLAELARRHVPHLGAWIYTGVGLGIALAGGMAWLGGRQPASWLWLELGLMALASAVFVGFSLPDRGVVRALLPAGVPPAVVAGETRGHRALVLCYGTYGFGYIVPATFLPVMARQQVSDPLVFGVTWPLFGVAAVLSVGAAACWMSHWPRRRIWALAQGTMALGTALPLATTALWALAVSAVLVGGTFMVATMAGLQLAREQVPANPTRLLGRMTTAFAVGQILGPVFIRMLGVAGLAADDALFWANAFATVGLVLTSAWLWHPVEPSHQGATQ